jgi:proline iminopeptidase
MSALYPTAPPRHEFRLDVGDGHQLYCAEYGRADGVPVVFLHGGPGAGTAPWHAGFFDPEIYRIILFDQRGSGRSTPAASLDSNTTWDLVADLELLRAHCGIERWLLFGGSWGSTLALAYAQRHPARVSAMLLRGIFLCRDEDIGWFYQSGADRLFPDYWAEYRDFIPVAERGDFVSAYQRRLTSNNPQVQREAARVWSLWEGRTCTLQPNRSAIDHYDAEALAIARIENHYFANACWLEPNQLCRDAQLLADIPAVIVHGRYDVVCPVKQAFDLHAAWPQAELRVIPDAGHSATEPGIRDALIEASDRFGRQLRDAGE